MASGSLRSVPCFPLLVLGHGVNFLSFCGAQLFFYAVCVWGGGEGCKISAFFLPALNDYHLVLLLLLLLLLFVFVGLKMSAVASYFSDIWLNLAQVPISQGPALQAPRLKSCIRTCPICFAQTKLDVSVSQLPWEPCSPRAFGEFRMEPLVFLRRCQIKERAVFLHLTASPLSPSHLKFFPPSFLPS